MIIYVTPQQNKTDVAFDHTHMLRVAALDLNLRHGNKDDSDWADALATGNHSVRWAQTPHCWVSYGGAQLLYIGSCTLAV